MLATTLLVSTIDVTATVKGTRLRFAGMREVGRFWVGLYAGDESYHLLVRAAGRGELLTELEDMTSEQVREIYATVTEQDLDQVFAEHKGIWH